MFIMRFVVFDLQESPKYLVAKGRDQEAIAVRPLLSNCLHLCSRSRKVLEHIAKRNGKTISLTLEKFSVIEDVAGYVPKSPLEVAKRAFSTISL